MDMALVTARANPMEHWPKIAALIFDKRKLIAVGLNQNKTHPLQAKFQRHPEAVYLHAEIAALAAVRGSCEGLTMYVARVGAHGEPRLAKPCWACQRAIMSFGLKGVYWSETEPKSN